MPFIAIDEPAPFVLHSPQHVEEALKLASDHSGNCAYLAGGCDLLDMMKRQWDTPAHVVDLKRITSFQGVSRTSGGIKIGALTKLAKIERSDFGAGLRALTDGAGRIASPQIRNMGTVGGNLLQDSRCPYYRGPFHCYRHGGIVCYAHHGINREHAIFGGNRCWTVSPSDLAPIMVALDAVIHTRDTGGEDSFPAARLFVPPSENITIMHRLQGGQILTAVEIPTREGRRSTFIKDTVRNSWNFSRISVAIVLAMDGSRVRHARIVLGGAATIPWRVQAAERVLEGAALNRHSIEKAAAASVKGATELNDNGYKIGLTRKLVRQALTQLA